MVPTAPTGLLATPFCGCRFYRKRVRDIVVELPKIRIRVESPLWLAQQDHEVALFDGLLTIVAGRNGVKLNGEPIRGAKLILPPT